MQSAGALLTNLWERIPRPSRPALRRWAIASLIAQIGIVVTGGAVRLTGSGLGCPTFPSCTDESLVNTPELGIHGVVEFGNRTLTFVVGALALAVLIAALRAQPRRRSVVRLAAIVLLGVPAQALIGGVTVLTDLNPWVVMLHFMCSAVLIGVATALVRRIDEGDEAPRPVAGPWLRVHGAAVLVVAYVVLYLGTIVTGTGPHAGDPDSPRTGLDLEAVSQLHVDGVFLLLGLSVGFYLFARGVGAPQRTVRAALVLLAVEVSQGLVGAVQYATDLPQLLVGVHMLGAALLAAAATDVWLSTRDRGLPPALEPDLSSRAPGRPSAATAPDRREVRPLPG